jgi:hypothetical protein
VLRVKLDVLVDLECGGGGVAVGVASQLTRTASTVHRLVRRVACGAWRVACGMWRRAALLRPATPCYALLLSTNAGTYEGADEEIGVVVALLEFDHVWQDSTDLTTGHDDLIPRPQRRSSRRWRRPS